MIFQPMCDHTYVSALGKIMHHHTQHTTQIHTFNAFKGVGSAAADSRQLARWVAKMVDTLKPWLFQYQHRSGGTTFKRLDLALVCFGEDQLLNRGNIAHLVL